MLGMDVGDWKKIGIGLTAAGVFFTFLGLVLFFDKALLAMGNVFFLTGVTLTIGPTATFMFFLKRRNYKGSLSFLVGFVLVAIGWPVIGMIVESYGFVVLFRGFLPTVMVFLYRVPLLGWFLQQPFFVSVQEGACLTRAT